MAILPLFRTTMDCVAGHTGYTHQWRASPEYADILMASCDSVAEANMLGFRTFRVAPATGLMKEKREILCPASKQAGKKTTCAECRACDGTSSRARCDVVIPRPWQWRSQSSPLRRCRRHGTYGGGRRHSREAA
jgi:hypothetical protein